MAPWVAVYLIDQPELARGQGTKLAGRVEYTIMGIAALDVGGARPWRGTVSGHRTVRAYQHTAETSRSAKGLALPATVSIP
jgi:hypothetical protein